MVQGGRVQRYTPPPFATLRDATNISSGTRHHYPERFINILASIYGPGPYASGPHATEPYGPGPLIIGKNIIILFLVIIIFCYRLYFHHI